MRKDKIIIALKKVAAKWPIYLFFFLACLVFISISIEFFLLALPGLIAFFAGAYAFYLMVIDNEKRLLED